MKIWSLGKNMKWIILLGICLQARMGIEILTPLNSFQQIKDWIIKCKDAGVGVSIHNITEYTLSRSTGKPMAETMIRALKATTGQNGPHTTALEMK